MQKESIGGIDYIDFHDSLVNGNIGELEKFCELNYPRTVEN